MAREQFVHGEARMIRAVEPVDLSDPNSTDALDNATDGMTASFRVYKGSRTSAVADAGQAIIVVDDTRDFIAGETAVMECEDGTVHSSVIASIDSATQITLTDNLPADLWGLKGGIAGTGQHVRVELGSEVAMAEFQPPEGRRVGFKDWGNQGAFASNHPAQIPGLDIDVVITVALAGGASNAVKTICATIVEECDIG